MVKIVEDGMEYPMEYTDIVGLEKCEKCEASSACAVDSILTKICDPSERICTSATPVQEEEKVYGPHNRGSAHHLIGRLVEGWHCGEWFKDRLFDITGYENDAAFKLGSGLCSTIREIPPRRLTQAQIIEAYPDLEGVELVGGWSNG